MIEDRDGIKWLVFGSGDIGVSTLLRHEESGTVIDTISFNQIEEGVINRELPHLIGKRVEEIEPQVIMQFTKPESVQVVITALQRVKDYLEGIEGEASHD